LKKAHIKKSKGNIKRHLTTQKTNEENLDNFLLSNGDKFMVHKSTFLDHKGKTETIRIYATKSMLDLLIDANYKQFFLDGTFKCVPKGP
jgi:hypothetical protein